MTFGEETGRVAVFMRRLGQSTGSYENPNEAHRESGADLVVVLTGRRIGIQVTDLDTGKTPGQVRNLESRLTREADKRGSTYFAWAQNAPEEILTAIRRSISRKTRTSCSDFDEFWLLICSGVPKMGAITSTFAMTPWIGVSALNDMTLQSLEKSKYHRAFIHAILGVEEYALYEWRRGGSWSKSTWSLSTDAQPSVLWQQLQDPELWADPDGWSEREAARILGEWQSGIPG